MDKNIDRRRLLKSATVAATGLAGVSATAQAAPDEDEVTKFPSVRRMLDEIGNPTVKSVTTNPLDNGRTDARLVVLETEIGEVRYIQLGEQKLGVHFQFADRTPSVQRRLLERYRKLPSDVRTFLLWDAAGDLVFIREATDSERAQLANATGVDDEDALMTYHSSYGGFVVEPQPEADQKNEALLVRVGETTADGAPTANDYSDYLITDNWTASDTVGGQSFDGAISSVDLSGSPSVSRVRTGNENTESQRVEAQDYDCSKNWDYQCSKSLVACAACGGICSTSMTGVTLVACLGCVGSSCNFAVPLSCSIFLDCWEYTGIMSNTN